MIGRTIAHYEILEKVGEGGMGVVYKARDTHLDRFVAIKVLPPKRVADPERKLRFVQEAKAASALNHPNIITVHDIASEAGVDFMVMEFVPGKTLDQLIGRKGLRLNDTLKYGAQIAAALATAHAAGIIHRDLKPGNVMVTEGGLVKVLDFGLAKLAEPEPADLAATGTLTPRTEEGAVVGTAAYMSPEQAQGKKLDARSDIFSFGSVLYEMVTGKRPFQGETKLSTLSAIVDKEPAPLSAIAGQTPPELEKLIARCLRKDLDRRAQNMADVKLALEELKEESESGKLRAVVAPARPRFSLCVVAALVLIVLVVSIITWWLTRSPRPAAAPTLTRLTWDFGLTTDPALSADGKLLAYASDRSGEGHLDIYVQQVGGGEPLRLTQGPGDKSEPTFSPDGTTIAFHSEQDGGVYLVSTLGGAPRKLAPEGRRPQFSPDGKLIAYWVGELGAVSLNIPKLCEIYIVPTSGGAPRQLRADFAAAALPIWSPDGTHLLFLGNNDEKLPPEKSIDWWATSLDSGPAIKTGALDATRTAELRSDIPGYSWVVFASDWRPDGRGVVLSARSGDSINLWEVGISPETFKVTGPPRRLTSGPTREESPSVVLGPSGAGRLAFASLTETLAVWSLPIKPNEGKVTGNPEQLTHDAAGDYEPALSRDGNKLLFVSARPGNQDVRIKDLRTGQESALTASGSIKWDPIFSPDGSKVSFSESGSWNVYMVPSTGGTPEMVCEACGEATDWSMDGKRIIGNTADGKAWVLDIASRRKSELLSTPHWVATDVFSPDDHWFSLLDVTNGHAYAAPFRGDQAIGDHEWVDIIEGEVRQWSPDGKLLYATSYRDGHRCIWAQRVNPANMHPVGAPFAVFHSHNARVSMANQGDLTLSLAGGRIVFTMGERTGNIWMAEFKP